jgi:glutathione-independent formaldehyde dehydrogenase
LKAVVYQEPFKVTVEQMPDPKTEAPADAVVRITTTNICGPDLHTYEGRAPAEPGFVFGHENVGIVEEFGSGVSRWNLPGAASRGTRVDPGGF